MYVSTYKKRIISFFICFVVIVMGVFLPFYDNVVNAYTPTAIEGTKQLMFVIEAIAGGASFGTKDSMVKSYNQYIKTPDGVVYNKNMDTIISSYRDGISEASKKDPLAIQHASKALSDIAKASMVVNPPYMGGTSINDIHYEVISNLLDSIRTFFIGSPPPAPGVVFQEGGLVVFTQIASDRDPSDRKDVILLRATINGKDLVYGRLQHIFRYQIIDLKVPAFSVKIVGGRLIATAHLKNKDNSVSLDLSGKDLTVKKDVTYPDVTFPKNYSSRPSAPPMPPIVVPGVELFPPGTVPKDVTFPPVPGIVNDILDDLVGVKAPDLPGIIGERTATFPEIDIPLNPPISIPQNPSIPYPQFPSIDLTNVELSLGGIIALLKAILAYLGDFLGHLGDLLKWLLKSLISMLSDLLEFLFLPRSGFIEENVGLLNRTFKNKFGDHNFNVLANALKMVSDPGGWNDLQITLYGHTATILSAKLLNEYSNVMKVWVSGLFHVFLFLYNVNQLYFLVRGTYLINIGSTTSNGTENRDGHIVDSKTGEIK